MQNYYLLFVVINKKIKYGTQSYENFDKHYASHSHFLFAANFVQAHINSSQRWFQSGRNEEFINAFINHVFKPKIKLSTKLPVDFESLSLENMMAIYWYITQDKSLSELLLQKSIRKKSFFSFLGFGPSEGEIYDVQRRLNEMNIHFVEKLNIAGIELTQLNHHHGENSLSEQKKGKQKRQLTTIQQTASATDSLHQEPQQTLVDPRRTATRSAVYTIEVPDEDQLRKMETKISLSAPLPPARTPEASRTSSTKPLPPTRSPIAVPKLNSQPARNLNNYFERFSAPNAGTVSPTQDLSSTAESSIVAPLNNIAAMTANSPTSMPPPPPIAPKLSSSATTNDQRATRLSLFVEINSRRTEDGTVALQLRPAPKTTDIPHPSPSAASTSQEQGNLLATMASSSSLLRRVQPQPSPTKDNVDESDADWDSLPPTPMKAATVQKPTQEAASESSAMGPSLPLFTKGENETKPTIADDDAVDNIARLQHISSIFGSKRFMRRRSFLTSPAASPRQPDASDWDDEASSPSHSP